MRISTRATYLSLSMGACAAAGASFCRADASLLLPAWQDNIVLHFRADEVHSPYITATFLVPTNDAFAALLHSLGSTKQQLLADPAM